MSGFLVREGCVGVGLCVELEKGRSECVVS